MFLKDKKIQKFIGFNSTEFKNQHIGQPQPLELSCFCLNFNYKIYNNLFLLLNEIFK